MSVYSVIYAMVGTIYPVHTRHHLELQSMLNMQHATTARNSFHCTAVSVQHLNSLQREADASNIASQAVQGFNI